MNRKFRRSAFKKRSSSFHGTAYFKCKATQIISTMSIKEIVAKKYFNAVLDPLVDQSRKNKEGVKQSPENGGVIDADDGYRFISRAQKFGCMVQAKTA